MPDVREKLVELLGNIYLPMMCGSDVIGEYRIPHKFKKEIASHLIANGVTIQRERGDIDLTRTTVLETGDVASGRVMARSDLAELEKAMERLGRFGELFVDYKGCSRGPMGRAGGVTLEEEVLLMPKITDVDGGEWIPVNAEALHELVERSRKLREERRWIPVTERLPSKEEYTAKAEDGTEYYVRLLIAYKTDIVEYEIGYYDGYKWMTEMPIRLIKDVVAWMPFHNMLQPPKGE